MVTVNDMQASRRDAHLECMREMLIVIGNAPESLLNSNNKEVILTLFQGLMSQGCRGGSPRGSRRLRLFDALCIVLSLTQLSRLVFSFKNK